MYCQQNDSSIWKIASNSTEQRKRIFFKLFTPNQFCCSFFWNKNHLCCSFEKSTKVIKQSRPIWVLFEFCTYFLLKKKKPRQCFWRPMHFIFVLTKNTFSLHQNWNRFLLLFFPTNLNLFSLRLDWIICIAMALNAFYSTLIDAFVHKKPLFSLVFYR